MERGGNPVGKKKIHNIQKIAINMPHAQRLTFADTSEHLASTIL
jgi:hypothetical protein